MAILGLPALGNSDATAFRALYFSACLLWIPPLALMQRALWRRDTSWRVAAPLLLAATYAMSVVNAVFGQRLAIGLGRADGYHWNELVRGLDGCWLALIVFCAIFAPWVAPHNPSEQYRDFLLTPPAWLEGGQMQFLLGTDELGRDLLSRLIQGSRLSLLIGLSSVLIYKLLMPQAH